MSERTFEVGKPLFFSLLLCAAAGGGIYWWTTRLQVIEVSPGFSVGIPPDWDAKTEEALLTATGFLPEGGSAHLRASYHPFAGDSSDWPDEALQGFPGEPDSTEATEIGGRRAVLVTFNTTGSRALGAAVDCGSGMVLFLMRCKDRYFDRNRSMFERSARSIRCTES